MKNLFQQQKIFTINNLTFDNQFSPQYSHTIYQASKAIRSLQAKKKQVVSSPSNSKISFAQQFTSDDSDKILKHLQVKQLEIQDVQQEATHERSIQSYISRPLSQQNSQRRTLSLKRCRYTPLESDSFLSSRYSFNVAQQGQSYERKSSRVLESKEIKSDKTINLPIEIQKFARSDKTQFLIDKAYFDLKEAHQSKQNIKNERSIDQSSRSQINYVTYLELYKADNKFDEIKKSQELCALSRRKFSIPRSPTPEKLEIRNQRPTTAVKERASSCKISKKCVQHQWKQHVLFEQKNHQSKERYFKTLREVKKDKLNEGQQIKEQDKLEKEKQSDQDNKQKLLLNIENIESALAEKQKQGKNVVNSETQIKNSSFQAPKKNAPASLSLIDLSNNPFMNNLSLNFFTQVNKQDLIQSFKTEFDERGIVNTTSEKAIVIKDADKEVDTKKKVVVVSRLRLRNKTSEKYSSDYHLDKMLAAIKIPLVQTRKTTIETEGEQTFPSKNCPKSQTTRMDFPQYDHIFKQTPQSVIDKISSHNNNNNRKNYFQQSTYQDKKENQLSALNDQIGDSTQPIKYSFINVNSSRGVSPSSRESLKIKKQDIEFMKQSKCSEYEDSGKNSQPEEIIKKENIKEYQNRSNSPIMQQRQVKQFQTNREAYLQKLRQSSPKDQTRLNSDQLNSNRENQQGMNDQKKLNKFQLGNNNNNLLCDANQWNKYQIVKSAQNFRRQK